MGGAGSLSRAGRGVGQDVEISDFFHGAFLNAVDAKGRVSLPATFRKTIDRRSRRSALPGEDDKIILVGEHEKYPCLQAFDPTFSRKLFENLEKRANARDDVDPMEALDEVQDAFGVSSEVAYDAAGRMVLSPLLRFAAGIDDLAFFVGNGETFQIWSPDRFREERADKPRLIRNLDFLIAERGGRA